ncbi:PREDICTED: alpha-latrotoxin-Lt1a-like [Populus euphratica]|uniref:Alpha-latrotoxin-Lt1a-like n=1 Tax=Populus euphratica TaxID=75702 RepID=A0AAJ6T3F3_POPEU|nr:PREDICTED: alpha-latrotoxin-Lt1a-like [Populus euphratica]
MDTRLFEAAQTGNIDYLQQLLAENPFILNNTQLSAENPLNIAAAMGHVDFVKEIIRLKPVFAREVNQEGFSPMHIAADNGQVEIVKEIMEVDIKLCRLEGRQKMTPFHHAAIRGRAEVIGLMLSGCPDCIEDETERRETALHLAVRNNRFEAIKKLVDWIREMNKEYLLNMKDEQGNTVFHLASWKKQRRVIEIFLGGGSVSTGLLEVNAINHTGITALDVILLFPSEAGDREIVEILRSAGAMRARDTVPSTVTNTQTSTDNPSTPERCWSNRDNFVEYFKFKKDRDSPSEARGALLVIAVLVATATFQVGVGPPGGVWQDTNIPDQKNITSSNTAHFAGQSIMATTNTVGFMLFVFFNSVGFSMSLYMLYVLTSKFPLQFELQICLLAMYCTYGTALSCIVPSNLYLFVQLTTTILSSTMSALARSVRPLTRMLRKSFKDFTHRVV